MRKWLGLCVGLMLAWQCQAGDFKLGYINIQRVYREATSAVAIEQKLTQEFAARRAELTALQAKGKKWQAALADDSLPEATRKSMQKSLDAVVSDYNSKAASLAEELNQRRNDEFAGFLERANQVVRQLAEQGHYDLILQDSVYVNPKYDLTDALLKQLDLATAPAHGKYPVR